MKILGKRFEKKDIVDALLEAGYSSEPSIYRNLQGVSKIAYSSLSREEHSEIDALIEYDPLKVTQRSGVVQLSRMSVECPATSRANSISDADVDTNISECKNVSQTSILAPPSFASAHASPTILATDSSNNVNTKGSVRVVTPVNVPSDTNKSTPSTDTNRDTTQSSVLPQTSTFSSLRVKRSTFTSIEPDSNINKVCSCCTSNIVQTNHAIVPPPVVSTESSALQTESHGHKRKHDVIDQDDSSLGDNDALDLVKLTVHIRQSITATISKAFPSAKQSRIQSLVQAVATNIIADTSSDDIINLTSADKSNRICINNQNEKKKCVSV